MMCLRVWPIINKQKVLIGLYEKTLEAVKQIPDSAAYRANVEKITEYRLEIVNGTEDIDEIETTLNVGQLPEIIEQAEDELELIPYMAQWKPWEKDGTKPAVIEIVD